MEPEGYELLKIETKIRVLEKELTILFENFKNIELKDRRIFEDERFKKLQNMNICCLKLLESYREYTTQLKKAHSVI
jgi:hypothetical protein